MTLRPGSSKSIPKPPSLPPKGPKSLLAPSQLQDDLFWKGLRTSAAAHSSLLILAVLLSLTLPRNPVRFMPTMRVDLVALPDVKKADLNKVQPDDIADLSKQLSDAGKSAKETLAKMKKEAEEPPAQDDTMAMKKLKEKELEKKKDNKRDDLKSAIDRIKALAAFENDVKKPNGKQQKFVAKGNEISKGSSLTGATATDASELNDFLSRMQGKLRENWNLPVWLATQKLKARVTVFLDRGGYVTNAVLTSSSGNAQFDDYALKTVRMSQPFGAPPHELIEDGATIGFPVY